MRTYEYFKTLCVLLFCVAIVACDSDDEVDKHEIRTCEIAPYKVMREVMLMDKKVELPHYVVTYGKENREYIVVSDLKGFDEYEEGVMYKVKLKITYLVNPPADWHNKTYLVLEILSKEKVTETV